METLITKYEPQYSDTDKELTSAQTWTHRVEANIYMQLPASYTSEEAAMLVQQDMYNLITEALISAGYSGYDGYKIIDLTTSVHSADIQV